jgi:glycosyltransferase involved in cell wall biosynthesis
VRVHIVDPSGYTPAYDDAVSRALARAGAEVELYTSRYTYGSLAPPEGYTRREHFYRLAHGRGAAGGGRPRVRPRAARALKLAEHVPDMLRYRRLARRADVVHFQWLPVQALDAHLLPGARRPRRTADGGRERGGVRAGARARLVLTAHDVLPREPLPGQRAAQARLYGHFDAIVVHSEHGRARLTGEVGVDPARVHVIPHGALPLPDAGALPAELRGAEGPVVLFFGLLRPYKGLDVLLDAWRELEAGPAGGRAELWIAGMPRMDTAPLRASASGSVRLLARFLSEQELAAAVRRASLVVLPYREIDASGAAFTALGAGVPMLLSDAGSFPELAASGAARCTPAGDPRALARALEGLLGDPPALAAMAAAARRAGAEDGPYGWGRIAAQTLALYRSLLGERPRARGAAVAA